MLVWLLLFAVNIVEPASYQSICHSVESNGRATFGVKYVTSDGAEMVGTGELLIDGTVHNVKITVRTIGSKGTTLGEDGRYTLHSYTAQIVFELSDGSILVTFAEGNLVGSTSSNTFNFDWIAEPVTGTQFFQNMVGKIAVTGKLNPDPSDYPDLDMLFVQIRGQLCKEKVDFKK